MRRGLIIFLAIVAAFLAAGVWFLVRGGTPVVEIAQVETGPATALVYATGFVEPEQPVVVSSRVTAPVREVLVEEGQRVTAGQSLVWLDDAEQRGQLAQAQAELNRAELAAGRVVTLHRQGWVTKAAHDEAVAARDAARAAVAALRARLDQFVIRAGVSGVVLKLDVYPGDLATPGQQLLELGDPARARITATVDERDITRVRVGQEALMSSEGLPEMVRGRVSEITPGGDPNQRAFRVRTGPEHTAIGGSSLGALISMHAAAKHPDVFGMVIAESPSLLTGNGMGQQYFMQRRTWPAKVYIGMSTSESGPDNPERSAAYVQAARELAEHVRSQGAEVKLLIGEGGHNEQAWAERLPEALEFLFGK